MPKTTYVWDELSDNIAAEYYHHHDSLGSTRFLTDSSGNVTDTYLHDAWGNSVAATGTTVNPFKWVGKYGYYTDNSTEQVYVRARMYQPIVARWSSVDPLWKKFRTGFWEYGHNSPIAMTSESGLEVPTYNPRDVSICKEKLELVAKTGWGYFPLAATLLERFLAGGGDVYLENWFFDMRDRVETIRPAIFLAIAKTLRPVCDYSSSITFDNEKAEIAFPKGSKFGNDLFWAINRARVLLSGNAEIECGKS